MPLIPVSLRAIIFDFDGVLADTEDLHFCAFQAVATAMGLHLSRSAYYERYLGLPDRATLAAICAGAGRRVDGATLDRLVQHKRAHFGELSGAAALYPGAVDAVRRLQPQFALAIASGAFRDEIVPILARAGIHGLFAAVIGAEDVSAGKPAPDPFLRALQGLNESGAAITAAQCVVIEDSPLGLTAARAAGMHCIGVTTHHSAATLALAEAVIEQISTLTADDLIATG